MAAEQFLAKWSRRKAETATGDSSQAAPALAEKAGGKCALSPENKLANGQLQPVSLEDVEKLTPDSDFTPFMARNVDEDVKRSALKKLFADPHYNVMDGLDIYIDDYNKFEPVTAAMLAIMNHAQALLNPLDHLKQPSVLITEADSAARPESEPGLLENAQADSAPATTKEEPLQASLEKPEILEEPEPAEHPGGVQADISAPEDAVTPTQPL